MNKNFPSPDRRSIRLKNYDYSRLGYYFVTICVQNRICSLGEIKKAAIELSPKGRLVQEIWKSIPSVFPSVQLDECVIMSNHLHGIIALHVGATFMAPVKKEIQKKGVINHAPTLGEIIRRFKAVSTRVIRQKGWNSFSWQRNYYEHVIRREESLYKIRRYILENPLKWELDEDNPQNILK